jgi:putative tryptophan/tyrosine transport system substrate-binding protein
MPVCLVSCLLCCFLTAPLNNARADERLISVIMTGNLDRYQAVQQVFLEHLVSADIKVYTQTPNPDPLSLANSIRKAVALNSALIVTYGAQAAQAARMEAGSVPVLFADVYDPVSLGLDRCEKATLCNISGISDSTPLHTLLRTLAELIPEKTSIAVLFSSNDPGSVHQCSLLEKHAVGLGFKVDSYDLISPGDLDPTLAEIAFNRQILFVSESALVQKFSERIMQVARENRLLVFSQVPGLCEKGALLTLEPGLAEQGTKLAKYVNHAMTGAPVSSMPVIFPHKVDLVLNLEIAKQHRLSISLQTLSRATRIIK